MSELEKAMGGRDGVIDSLMTAELSPKQGHFLALLLDPLRERDSLATICADAAISPHELLDLFRSANFAKAHALSLSYIASKTLDVAKDVVDKAVDKVVQCPACTGEGKREGKLCKKCNGKGKVIRASDVDRQKIVLESAGILKKGGGVSVSVQQNTAVMSGPSTFSKFVKSSDDLAYDVKMDKSIEAEVIDEP